MPETPFYTTLNNRGVLRISGKDARPFLQGLITNDIDLLGPRPSLYACLLSPQGKFMFDFFISQDSADTLILDCEGAERLTALARLLGLYKLRSDITINTQDNTPVYAVFGTTPPSGTPDPRHPDMGWRTFLKPDNLPEQLFSAWDTRRIALTIPDGSRDMIVQKSTLLECGIDKLNGVSFDKGCYMGQELTARMHYRGLAKKHLRIVTLEGLGLETFPTFGEEIRKNEILMGDMRSHCGDIGLALLKDPQTDTE